jgi:aspartyl-tRNA(Asn)/glutamyl-tRNA(Gln) amidotransferase subunit B
MGDVQKMLNRGGASLSESPLTPARLAELLSLLDQGKIHGKLAKQTLQVVFDEDKDPSQIISERGWEQISDPEELGRIVANVLEENQSAVEQIRSGDAKPKGFLVGQIMKATNGRADPAMVQSILSQKLSLQFVQVLSFGGAISGTSRTDGVVVPGDLSKLIDRVKDDPSLPNDLRYEPLDLGRFLSEEVTPTDWAGLIAAVGGHVSQRDASGLVVATGTDTLSYTASLLHWLFGESALPIVLTASSSVATSEESGEAFKTAVRAAVSGTPGVSVVFGTEQFPAVNLKFERVPGSSDDPVFRTWNAHAVKSRATTLYDYDLKPEQIAEKLEAAVQQSFIAKVFPGMQSSTLRTLIDAGVRFFVLELYDSGTANVRETPFSLREALEYGQSHGALFFCTSQQEGNVDFSTYLTSHELWREGAIPMGALTTESVYGLLMAVLLTTDQWDSESIASRMERAE